MNRIDACFSRTRAENRAALVTYVMAFDPTRDVSAAVLDALPRAGVDIIELGMPFSDPMADGPVIQESGVRALKAGAKLHGVLAMAKQFRANHPDTPLVLMGYYNPIYHFGIERFVAQAKESGVDGVIIVDLTPEEEKEFTNHAIPAGIAHIKLTAPTTTEARARKVLQHASGFVYYISIAGITGTRSADISDIAKGLTGLRKITTLPLAVGFGIKTPAQAAEAATIGDAVVVGSAIVNLIKENAASSEKAVAAVTTFTKEIAEAVRGARAGGGAKKEAARG